MRIQQQQQQQQQQPVSMPSTACVDRGMFAAAVSLSSVIDDNLTEMDRTVIVADSQTDGVTSQLTASGQSQQCPLCPA